MQRFRSASSQQQLSKKEGKKGLRIQVPAGQHCLGRRIEGTAFSFSLRCFVSCGQLAWARWQMDTKHVFSTWAQARPPTELQHTNKRRE
eukprot:1157694-Pelagomonas_calceolata.AAC.13